MRFSERQQMHHLSARPTKLSFTLSFLITRKKTFVNMAVGKSLSLFLLGALADNKAVELSEN